MDSSEGTKRKAKDVVLGYQRRKKDSNSEKRVSDSNKNISAHSESLMAKTNSSLEIEDDGSYYDCELCNDGNDGGELLCCEACPRTYHLECLGLKSVPKGEYMCCGNCFDDNQLSMSIKHFKI